MEDYTKNLRSASSSQTWEDDDSPENKALPVVPVEVYESSDEERAEDELAEQLNQDEELAREIEDAELEGLRSVKQRELEAAKHRDLEAAKESELEAAKERERETAEEKVLLIMQIMEEQEKKRKAEGEQQQKTIPDQRHRRETKAKQTDFSSDESEEESSEEESSEDEIMRWAMKEATAMRKARETNRKTRDQAQMNALNIRQPYPVPGTNERKVTITIRTKDVYIKKGMSFFRIFY